MGAFVVETVRLEGTGGVEILLHSRSTRVLFRPVSKRLCVLDVKLGSETKIVIAGDWNACAVKHRTMMMINLSVNQLWTRK